MSEKPLGQVRGVLLLVVLLTTAASEVVSAPPGQSPLMPIGIALGLTALAGLLGRFPRPRRADELVPSPYGLPLLVGALLLPFPMEWLRRGFIDARAVEILLLEALRNTTLVLAALSAWPICLRLAGLTSLFLVLFAAGIADEQPLLTWILAGYVSVGTYWLILLHWTGVCSAWANAPGASARPPWSALLGTFVLLGVFLAAGAAGPRRAARVLMELMPTSGGTGDYDPAARGGVNDGDDETMGENAQSAGSVDTDVFIEDDKPSLYDAITDQYGEPFRPKDQDQAVAINPSKVLNDRHPSENLAARREFPTTRQKPDSARRPPDRHTTALFFVQGRTPLHLRMAAYDRFDGVTWHEATAMNNACLLEDEPDGSWMRLHELNRRDMDAGSESHELRFATLKSSRFPTPPHLFAFRLGKVSQPRFFAWVHPGVLRIRRARIPAGVSLRTEAHVPSSERLVGLDFPGCPPVANAPGSPPSGANAPGSPSAEVCELARRWAGDTPPGWPQIEKVVNRLRHHAVHDPEFTVPRDCRDSVAHFLLHSKRGPDYLFAGALAVQLRSLGYTTRVVSGFYAAPERFDPVTRQTPVLGEDVHFWTEVLGPGSVWLVLEPTPGYEVLQPQPGLFAPVLAGVKALGVWLVDQAVAIAGFACVAVVLWLWRRRLLDRVGVLLWEGRARRGWRAATLGALWLLERRSRWAGRERPAGCAPVRWSRRFQPVQAGELPQLAALADCAAFAPAGEAPPCPVEEALALCRRALREWTVRRFRQCLREEC